LHGEHPCYFWGKQLSIIAVQTGNDETNDHMAAPRSGTVVADPVAVRGGRIGLLGGFGTL
jgi:hypothetical protein